MFLVWIRRISSRPNRRERERGERDGEREKGGIAEEGGREREGEEGGRGGREKNDKEEEGGKGGS